MMVDGFGNAERTSDIGAEQCGMMIGRIGHIIGHQVDEVDEGQD